jgi:NodT family efflux transporter outer membrane factor (OMF) lipoprotein
MKPSPRSSHTTRAVTTAIACGFLLLLSGCGIPKLIKPAPAPPMPPNFALPETFSGETGYENSAVLPIYEFFPDPHLTMLFDQALVGNQELRILAQDIAIANNEIRRRRGAYLPFFSLGGGARLIKYSQNTIEGADVIQNVPASAANFPNPYPVFLFPAVDISWQVDIWRQLRNARDAAGLRYLGTIDGRNFVVTRLVADIAENYYTLMGLDQRLETLDRTIALQERSFEMAKAQKEGVRGTELGVQRFQAEVRKNQSEKLIIYQQIIETQNRINFLCGRYPQPVERISAGFIDMNLHALNVGVPAQLLANRPDIRKAERELQAAGLDIRVARANFFPKATITAGVGYEAFNPKYLFITPESLIYNVAGNLVAPLINKSAIRADYMNANATQLQAIYDYQRTIINAFTEVVNNVSKVQNYSRSIELKKQQLAALETAVDVASNLFQNARVEYVDVLFSQRDRNDARIILIETKREQLSAIVRTYQSLGGGWQNGVQGPLVPAPNIEPVPPPPGNDDHLPTPVQPQPNQPQPANANPKI